MPYRPQVAHTILVVDDEPAARRVMARALSESGFRVLLARDGLDALRAIGEDGGAIDLVVTDLSMPHMDGRVLAAQLVAHEAHVPVLFVGTPTDPRRVPGPFLPKPFSPLVLSARVRALLAEQARSAPARSADSHP